MDQANLETIASPLVDTQSEMIDAGFPKEGLIQFQKESISELEPGTLVLLPLVKFKREESLPDNGEEGYKLGMNEEERRNTPVLAMVLCEVGRDVRFGEEPLLVVTVQDGFASSINVTDIGNVFFEKGRNFYIQQDTIFFDASKRLEVSKLDLLSKGEII